MLEPPSLSNALILACLREAYGLDVAGLDFLPLGNDAAAWVYRVALRGGESLFLKLKQGEVYPPGLSVPHALSEEGIVEVVAPLATRGGALCQALEGFSLVLYPFIEGQNGMAAGLTTAQWADFGRALRRIHETRLPAPLLSEVRRETFQPAWGGMVRGLQDIVAGDGFQDPAARALADFWSHRAGEIARVVDRCEALGRALHEKQLPPRLCHTDIHTANLLVDARGRLHIVDWDQPLLAPVERDLMFFFSAVDGRVEMERPEQVAFLRGYGPVAPNPLALAYYQHEWAVQELGDDGQRVLLTPGLGEASRHAALRHLMQCFDPGDVIDAAVKSGF